jgi:hypothetical protein
MPPAVPVASGGNDKTVLWGIIGIVTAVCCCGILGIIFGYLSIQEAKKSGKSPVLGYVAIGLGVLGLIWNIFAGVRFAGNDWNWNNDNNINDDGGY